MDAELARARARELLCGFCGAACYTLAVLRCETYLQVRRTAAGRCCSLTWWWTTASQHGCTRSPWKQNTWTHSPPLLERQIKNVGWEWVRKTQNMCVNSPKQMWRVHISTVPFHLCFHAFVKDLNKKCSSKLDTNYIQPAILKHWRVLSLDITVNTSSFLDCLNNSLLILPILQAFVQISKYLKGKQHWRHWSDWWSKTLRAIKMWKYWHL